MLPSRSANSARAAATLVENSGTRPPEAALGARAKSRHIGTLGATIRRRIVALGVPLHRRIVSLSAQCAEGLFRLDRDQS